MKSFPKRLASRGFRMRQLQHLRHGVLQRASHRLALGGLRHLRREEWVLKKPCYHGALTTSYN